MARSRSAAAHAVRGVVVALLLAACSSPPHPSDERFPVTVAHRFGSTDIPDEPHRIVALTPGDRDVLLALDIVPVGMPGVDENHGPLPVWTARQLADVRRRTGVTTVPVEAGTQPSAPDVLPAAEQSPPDLLLAVAGGMGQQDYDDDTAIAPVVAPPRGYGRYDPPPAFFGDGRAPWYDATRMIGAAVGKPVEAERLVTDVEARFAHARTRHPRIAGRTAVCARLGPSSSPQIYAVPAGPRTPCARFLAELGLRGVPALDGEPGQPDRAVSAAQIAAARPDLIVLDDPAQDGGASQDVVRVNLAPGQRTVGLDPTEAAIVTAPNVLNLPAALNTVPAKLDRALS